MGQAGADFLEQGDAVHRHHPHITDNNGECLLSKHLQCSFAAIRSARQNRTEDTRNALHQVVQGKAPDAIKIEAVRALGELNGDDTAVINGQTGTLLAIDDSGLVVRLDHDDTLVRIDNDYVAAGGIDYAYATTAHRAQGGTWDLAIAVGLDGLYREAGYLVMSRGRQSNWLVLTQPELDSLDHDVGRHVRVAVRPLGVARRLLAARRQPGRDWLLALPREPFNGVLRDLERAFTNFFAKRAAEPRFKSKGGVRPDDVGTAPAVWGMSEAEYRKKADVWPLNPEGELINWTIVESKTGLANLKEIAAVPGIGVLWPGAGTLRGVFSTTGADGKRVLDEAAWENAIQSVLAACKANKIACGFPANATDIETRMKQGFNVFVMNWGDAGFKTVEMGRKLANRTDTTQLPKAGW